MLPNGICYTYNNATTIYAYPGLSCVEGSTLPNFNNRTRDTYIRLENGRWVKSATTTASVSSPSTQTIAHIYEYRIWDDINPNSFILPATLFIICFFNLILKWFMGLRR